MFKSDMICRICGVELNGNNLGYVSTSKKTKIFECRSCHAPNNPPAPKPRFKSWQLLGRKLHY